MFLALLKKEMHCFFRARQWPVSVVLFAFVLVVVASFSFRRIGYGPEELLQMTPGILWLIFLFCGIVSLNYSFFHEEEGDALKGFLLTATDPAVVFLSKWFVNTLFLFLIMAFVTLVHGLLFNLSLFEHAGSLALVFLLVSIGFSALGTLFAAMSVSLRGRELILPLLLFPLSLPLLSAGIHMSDEIFGLQASGASYPWFLLALSFDAIALTLATVLFEFVVRDT